MSHSDTYWSKGALVQTTVLNYSQVSGKKGYIPKATGTSNNE